MTITFHSPISNLVYGLEEEGGASGGAKGGLSWFALNISTWVVSHQAGIIQVRREGGRKKGTEGGKKCLQLLLAILLS